MKTRKKGFVSNAIVYLFVALFAAPISANNLGLREFVSEQCYLIEDHWINFAVALIDRHSLIEKDLSEGRIDLNTARDRLSGSIAEMEDVLMKSRINVFSTLNEHAADDLTRIYTRGFVVARESGISQTVLKWSDGVPSQDRVRRRIIENCLLISKKYK